MTNVLDMQVLKLNKNYVPLEIITVKDAFSKLASGRAEIVTIEDGTYCNYDIYSWTEASELKREFEEFSELDDWLDLSSLTIQVPRIIRCLFYDKVPIYGIKLNRKNIYARDHNTCQYCGKKFNTKELTLDHVIPKKQGGTNLWTNLVCACVSCNSKKGGRTPSEAGMKLKRKPFQPDYSPTMRIHIGNKKYHSWKNFLSDAYWNIPLE